MKQLQTETKIGPSHRLEPVGNYNHRVWMGQKMAYYLRNPNAQ
jgi:hypothetical protein